LGKEVGAGDIYGDLQHGHFKLKLPEAINLDLISETKRVSKVLLNKGLTRELDSFIETNYNLAEKVAFD